MRSKVGGRLVEDFFVEKGNGWIIAGGIKNGNLGEDSKDKFLDIETDGASIRMEKGRLHVWTRYSEDCILFFRGGDTMVVAVFDGVSGPMDGSGGLASRKGAEILIKYLKLLDKDSCEQVMKNYKDECVKKIAKGSSAAIILLAFGNDCFLFNKGDSYCFHKGERVNKLHDLDSSIYRWLNSEHDFDVYRFAKDGEITLYSDGYEDRGHDDFTMIKIE